jgi:uncharacterized protein with HEPN domain
VVHGYNSVSDETMWGIVINHLPPLKSEIERLLGDDGRLHNTAKR